MTATLMTGLQVLEYIKRTFKRTDKDTELYEAMTDTIMDIKLRFPFDDFKEESYSGTLSVLGEYKLNLPDDFGHLIGDIRLLDGNDGYVLGRKSKQQFDIYEPHPNAANVQKWRPQYYCVFGGQILVAPVPDKLTYLYEFSYTTEEAIAMGAIVDVPLSSRYREAIKYGVLRRIYVDMGQDEEALKWANHYEAEIRKMIENDKNNSTGIETTAFNDI